MGKRVLSDQLLRDLPETLAYLHIVGEPGRGGLLDIRHVRRGENNYRDYCEEAVEHLLMIKEVQAAGFTLAEFKELDEACNAADELVTQKAATFIRRKIAAVGEKIAELERVQTYLTSKLAEMLQ